MEPEILIAGGYGEVGKRVAAQLEVIAPRRVVVGGRHPARAKGVRARALEGVGLVVACVRQREPHLLAAAVYRRIAYTSIAPPWITWKELQPLRDEAVRTGARIVVAARLERASAASSSAPRRSGSAAWMRSRRRSCCRSVTRTDPTR